MFIKPSIVKAYLHGRGYKARRDFLHALDCKVEGILEKCCSGHHKLLGADSFMGVPPTGRK